MTSITIPLSATSGAARAYAVIDAADAPLVADANWTAWVGTRGGSYAYRNVRGRPVYMHRVILGLATGDGHVVDHISGDGLDNRRANLRIGTYAQNSQNQGARRGSTSRFRGVYFNKHAGRWMARVKLNYVHNYLGLFDDEVEAAKAAQAFRDEHMPFAQPDPALAAATGLEELAA